MSNMVGNDFVLPKQQPRVVAPEPVRRAPIMPQIVQPMPAAAAAAPQQSVSSQSTTRARSLPNFSGFTTNAGRFIETAHRNSLIVFSILVLLIGISGTQVAARYAAAKITASAATVQSATPAVAPAITGFNKSVRKPELAHAMQGIINQPAHITVGDKAVTISPETIQGWLQISSIENGKQTIHVKQDAIVTSIKALAAQNLKAPINQISATHDGQSQVIASGTDGTQLANAAALDTDAQNLAKNLLDAQGIQLNAPTSPLPFSAITPVAYSKMIEVNVDTKQMYLYDGGNLIRTYPISAGAPTTPTPIGQFKIFSKLPVQDMNGLNPNGTKYFQPHVHWINYFLPGGYAVHGNYWRPLSAFGSTNTSHGCVSLPDDQAEWVYNWAPLGTPVVTHHS